MDRKDLKSKKYKERTFFFFTFLLYYGDDGVNKTLNLINTLKIVLPTVYISRLFILVEKGTISTILLTGKIIYGKRQLQKDSFQLESIISLL